MKNVALSLLCAATALTVSASAFALDTRCMYNAHIVNGVYPISVGQMLFDLDMDMPMPGHRVCRYYYEWANAANFTISAEGYLVESKAHAAASCLFNAQRSVTSILMNDPHVLSTGFDRFQQVQPCVMLVLGESSLTGVAQGLIQFSPASVVPSFMANSFEIEPVPYI